LFLLSFSQKGQVKIRVGELTKIDFQTQYMQFYICDRNSSMALDDEFWNEEAYRMRLANAPGILGVGTECYGPVKGEIEFLLTEPNTIDLNNYDHVVEGDLEIKSGVLQIQDCPNGAVEFEKQINPGHYRVRVYSSNLASVEGDEGEDYYRVEVWGSDPIGKNLLKEYKNSLQ
jgi:hypothetical protein